MPDSTPIVSAWIVMPVAILTMLFIVAHTLMVQSESLSPSTRRIRTATGFLTLLLTPALAYGLSVARVGSAELAREFAITWMIVVGLVGMVLLLALLDMVNNVRLFAGSRKRLNQLAAQRLAMEAIARLVAAKPAHVHATRRHGPRE